MPSVANRGGSELFLCNIWPVSSNARFWGHVFIRKLLLLKETKGISMICCEVLTS